MGGQRPHDSVGYRKEYYEMVTKRRTTWTQNIQPWTGLPSPSPYATSIIIDPVPTPPASNDWKDCSEPTITRVLGWVRVQIATGSVTALTGAMGLALVPFNAAGATYSPDPIDDSNYDWMWWSPFFCTLSSGEAGGGRDSWIACIDSRVMRKVKEPDKMRLLFAIKSANAGLSVASAWKILLKD